MADRPRLIEVAFPLKETSIDSVHEKNVRHGHISTLHIWPARRPLAACRAALIATLLPDPGNDEEREMLLEKIGGKVVQNEETGKDETEGGILHWGRESGPDMDWFREKIREAYGGRAPRVLDPFAGGGAIPLEAMRLGCEVTAVDINPVAWFILKCTLEYPQKLAGKKLPLPKFAMEIPAFRKAWDDAQTKAGKKRGKQKPGTRDMWEGTTPEADLAWHVRAWGYWVLERARKELEKYYPVVDGNTTVAYLWARTVKCKGCGATIPLLKTRWLCKKPGKRVVLAMTLRENKSGVDFDISYPTATMVKDDKKIAAGTMSRSGAQCPCCPAMMTMEDIRLEGQAGRLGSVMTSVVVNGMKGKAYRAPVASDVAAAEASIAEVGRVFGDVPFGLPNERINTGSITKGGVSITRWGLLRWADIFTPRQLVALGVFARATRTVQTHARELGYDSVWTEAIMAYLALVVDRVADRGSTVCHWDIGYEKVANTFTGYRLPISWDFAETSAVSDSTGSYSGQLEWVALYVAHAQASLVHCPSPTVQQSSAMRNTGSELDAIVTDPPYYNAIPYADLMDFFYVWLRRVLHGLSPEIDEKFAAPVFARWDHNTGDGELISDESRFEGDNKKAKAAYEHGMAQSFRASYAELSAAGKLVIVFANKQPDAWETLVGAMIKAGFVVNGSWPIQTEMGNRTRALSSAALSSSVWLVCKKRPESVRPGWDDKVLDDMRERISTRLHAFWDAGIRGPDFVWAATGPALEAYSKYPVVKKANKQDDVMTVSEFLRHVRRIVVDFVVGRVLTGGGGEAISGLDDVTTYYLLHRHDFRMADAPAGASILYAVSCNLTDRDLTDRFDLLVRTGGKAVVEEEPEAEDDEEEPETGGGSGNKVKLKAWDQRRGQKLGLDIEGKPAPLIDQVHHVMHLWRTGEQLKVNQYLDASALSKSRIFHKVLQALIELAPEGSEERAVLESISNHVGVPGRVASSRQIPMPDLTPTDE
jgi:adenine-specific DNA methylase